MRSLAVMFYLKSWVSVIFSVWRSSRSWPDICFSRSSVPATPSWPLWGRQTRRGREVSLNIPLRDTGISSARTSSPPSSHLNLLSSILDCVGSWNLKSWPPRSPSVRLSSVCCCRVPGPDIFILTKWLPGPASCSGNQWCDVAPPT